VTSSPPCLYCGGEIPEASTLLYCTPMCRSRHGSLLNMERRRRKRGARERKSPKPSAVPLPNKATPIQLMSPDPDRRRLCAHVIACLCYAITKDWNGFGCGDCKAFEPETPRSTEGRKDVRYETWNPRSVAK
jgi:hypothetical protein